MSTFVLENNIQIHFFTINNHSNHLHSFPDLEDISDLQLLLIKNQPMFLYSPHLTVGESEGADREENKFGQTKREHTHLVIPVLIYFCLKKDYIYCCRWQFDLNILSRWISTDFGQEFSNFPKIP